MDLVLILCDKYFFTDYLYPQQWTEDNTLRQFISLLIITNLGGLLMYLSMALLNYCFIFDTKLLNHPLILENQIRKEICYAVKAIPFMAVLTVPIFLLEVQGYSKLYNSVEDAFLGYWAIPINAITFIAFTDFLIYWIHRGLHHKLIYKHIHKDHHMWKVPTPFASHAFHPVDGFLQSVPYHIYPFIFPLHKLSYLFLFVFVNVWTVSIHDGNYRVPKILRSFINGSAHHTDHHLLYNCNYGQFFTLWDRIGKSFHHPLAFDGKGPNYDVNSKKEICKKSS